MIQKETVLNVADNSGAKALKVIGIPKKGKARVAYLGDVVTVSVKGADAQGVVKDHSIQRVVLVRTKKEVRRKDGSYIRFDDNAGVIIDQKSGNPKGSRIFGPVAREVRERGFKKIASLAKEVY
jgi:large subunit ribosomal protein L14